MGTTYWTTKDEAEAVAQTIGGTAHDLGDGCEVNVTNNVNNCSACGATCPTRANASRTCAMSACGFVCNMGFGDCNGASADGCEQSLNVMGNCGACGASPSETCDGREVIVGDGAPEL